MIFLQMKVRPKAILIDCSELELGRNLGQRRGRPDDNLEAYKRRLQHYREHCLPMLKALVRNIVLDEVITHRNCDSFDFPKNLVN